MLTNMQSKIKPTVGAGVNPVHPLARGLAGCWFLNEGAGTTVRDIAGSHHDGSMSGDPTWSPSELGPAVEFDGSDDWISMGDCLDLGTGDVSVLAVVKYDAAGQPDQWSGQGIGAIVGKGCLDGAGKGYGLLVGPSNQIYWQVRNLGTELSAVSDAAFNDGQWHWAVGVCDRDDSTGVRLYIDAIRQSATADATALDGIDLNGSRAFAVGSRQEETTGAWYWDFLGAVAVVCVWKRVLAESEIRGLQQSLFGLFAPRQALAQLWAPTTAVPCSGSAQATASASGTLRVVRPVAGAIHASTSVDGVLSAPGLMSLSGTVQGFSALHGALSCSPGPEPFQGMLETPFAWRREAVFNGATDNALKLGTTLTQGWFWMRRSGCTAVYHGRRLTQVDLGRILHVVEPEAMEISLPAYLSYPPGSVHCYLVRRFDGCGRQEKTTAAAIMLRISPNGQSALLRPNGVIGLTSRQTGPTTVRWVWFYCPLDQEAPPKRFNLYGAGATPIGLVRYKGRRSYRFDAIDLADGQSACVVRAAGVAGVESKSPTGLVHPIITTTSEPPVILVAEPI